MSQPEMPGGYNPGQVPPPPGAPLYPAPGPAPAGYPAAGAPVPPPAATPAWKRPPVIIAAIVVLVAVGVGAFFLFRGPDTSSPEGVVAAAFEAAKAGDIEAARELTCAAEQDSVDLGVAPPGVDMSSLDIEFEVTGSKINGDEAIVTYNVSLTFMGQTMSLDDQEVRVVLEGGSWKICD